MDDEKLIKLRPSDLRIRDVETREAGTKEVVNIKNALGFDETFLDECKQKGVKKFVDYEEEEREEEDQEEDEE